MFNRNFQFRLQNRNRFKHLLKTFAICTGLTQSLILSGCSVPAVQKAELSAAANTVLLKDQKENIESGDVTVHVLDVGQGLSLIIQSEGKTLMYDGGDRDKSSYVVSWLKKHDVSEISDMIASHYDADHINGLVGALNTVQVDQVYAPDYSCTTRVCNSFDRLIDEKNLKLIHPHAGDSFQLGSAEVTFVAPGDHTYEDENNYSGAIRIDNGKTSCLITGDAMKESEQEMVSRYGSKLKSDVYIAGHHGSSSSSTPAFLDAADPSSVVISCGKNNSYGHPDASVLEEFKNRKMDVYRTDEQGEITFVMTEDTITFRQKTAPDPFKPGVKEEKSEKPQSETAAGKQTSSAPSNPASGGPLTGEQNAQDYILNIRSKKIHLPDCKSVKKMSEKNKKAVHSTLADLESQGYEPCKNCLSGF